MSVNRGVAASYLEKENRVLERKKKSCVNGVNE